MKKTSLPQKTRGREVYFNRENYSFGAKEPLWW